MLVAPAPDPQALHETARVAVWQCVGCGRIEDPRPCIGVCRDRKAEFVDASTYDAALAQLALMRRQMEELAALVRQIAYTAPRAGEYERTWLALQLRARRALDGSGSEEQS